MQHSPIQRTFRLVIFSIGFVLFIIMAVYSVENAANPRAVRGQPFVLNTPNVLAQLGSSNGVADAAAPVLALVAATHYVSSSHVQAHKASTGNASHTAAAVPAAMKKASHPASHAASTSSKHASASHATAPGQNKTQAVTDRTAVTDQGQPDSSSTTSSDSH